MFTAEKAPFPLYSLNKLPQLLSHFMSAAQAMGRRLLAVLPGPVVRIHAWQQG